MLTCAVLVANNLRDIPTDEAVGKRTLAVMLGDRGTRRLYAALVLLPFVLTALAGLRCTGRRASPAGALARRSLVGMSRRLLATSTAQVSMPTPMELTQSGTLNALAVVSSIGVAMLTCAVLPWPTTCATSAFAAGA